MFYFSFSYERNSTSVLSLINAAKFHHDPHLQPVLQEKLGGEKKKNVVVHASCQKRYTDFRKRPSSNISPPLKKAKSTRSSMTGFDWKTSCLFCAEMCVIDERNISREKERIRRVETIEMRRKILERCEIKTNEERTNESNLKKTEVQHRMLSCFDLVAAEAVYHNNCHKEFFNRTKHKQFDN